MDIARHLQGPPGMPRGKHATMDRPVTIQLADPGKFHFDKLRLEPDGLEIQGHGLPDIDHLREAGQSVEVQSKFKTLWVPCLRQECSGLGRIVATALLKAHVPVRIPDARPDDRAELRMVPHDPMRLYLAAKERTGCEFSLTPKRLAWAKVYG